MATKKRATAGSGKLSFTSLRMHWSVPIGLCMRDLHLPPGNPPTAEDFHKWANAKPELFPKGLTLKQAEYIVAHPDELVPSSSVQK